MKKRSGFTLVELSIVLIVIGILTGGILKGQDVIRNAKLKRIASDFANVVTAMYTYEDRYDQLPGDDATSVIAASMPTPGNEDGIISATESKMVFRHLRKAGLLQGDSDSSALQHALNGQIHVIQASQVGSILADNDESIAELHSSSVCFDNVSTDDAQVLDSQNDDGVYNKGSVQAVKSYKHTGSLTAICFEI